MTSDEADHRSATVPVTNGASKKLPRNVKILGLASLLNDIASEMVFPLLPAFLIQVLHGTKTSLGLMEGVADSVSSLLRLFSGAWSDRAGSRKVFVIFGYALAALARPLSGLAGRQWHLFATRTADRIGKGIRTSPRDALIADSTMPEMRGRAFGFHQAMDHLGAAVGPLLAMLFLFIWPRQLRTLFFLTLIPGILVVVLITVALREKPHSEPKEKPALPQSLRPLNWRFRFYLIALVLFTLGNSSDAFLLVRSSELGVQQSLLPLLWCLFHIVKTVSNLVAGHWTDRTGARPLLIIGWLAYGAVYLCFALASVAWHAWAIFLIYGFVYSLTEPAAKAMVTELVPAERKGLAFGWFHFAIGVGALPSSLIFGWLYDDFGAWTAFGWGATSAALASMLLLIDPAIGRARLPPSHS
ncbi:MAG TPA: MFS transporter [Pirellulaceae bacterium]|jgi:MFS family permease